MWRNYCGRSITVRRRKGRFDVGSQSDARLDHYACIDGLALIREDLIVEFVAVDFHQHEVIALIEPFGEQPVLPNIPAPKTFQMKSSFCARRRR